MTSSEVAFLALGLVLGVAAGAFVVGLLRTRPPAPPEVRVTMAPAVFPTRSTTLTGEPYQRAGVTAPGGPGDRPWPDRQGQSGADSSPAMPQRPSLVPVAAQPPSSAAALGGPVPGTAVGSDAGRPRPDLVAIPVVAGPAPGPAPVPLRSAAPAAVGVIDREAGTIAEALPSTVVPAVGVTPAVAVAPAIASAVVVTPAVAQGLDSAPQAVAESRASVPSPEPTVVAEAPGPTDPPGPAGAPSTRPAAEGPCGELRVVAEDRCTVAARAREGAAAAGTALREAQRSYDDHLQHADEADALADPRAVRSAKESAQHAFRAAREQSGSREALETAARTWLETINRINMEARDAAARATKARAAANALVTNLERLTAEADAARIAMEAAEEACVAARQAVAECEEEAAAAASAGAAAEAVRSPAVPPAPLASPEGALHYPEDEPELSPVALGEHEARVIRIVRGDRDALYRTAAELGGDDASARREWQVALTGLVDAVLAQAIDASLLDVPDSPAFWAPFTAAQRREIVAALASLGYRFDGVDAFVDGRIPSQRDLSLALGYAGLDPMRVRHWPTESEASRLLSGVRVAADEYLAGAAGGLRLSEMIDLLGRRADGLTDLWNEWGRVRPRLLAID